MRAVTIVEGRVEWAERPDPEPRTGEVAVRVRTAGVNGADLQQVAGRYPAPPGSPPDIPGLEVAGEVAACGPGVRTVAEGDRVMAIVGGGAHAEIVIVHERHLMLVPDNLDWMAAGGFPEAFATAYDALFTQAQLAMGERVCVHGAAGGVGTAAVQLAAAAGASVVATVRNPRLRDAVQDLGGLVTAPDGFTDHGPFDVVVEILGGTNIGADLAALSIGGRIAVIGVSAGIKAEVNLLHLLARRARLSGSTLRARSLEEKALLTRRLEYSVVPLLAAGRIHVPVFEAYPMDRATEAYEAFAAGGKFGKIILIHEN